MNQISKTIAELKSESGNAINFYDYRPVIDLPYNVFIERLTANANIRLRNMGSKEMFYIKNEDNDEYFIKLLYQHAICDPNSISDLRKGIFMIGTFGTGKTLLMTSYLELFNQAPLSKNVTIKTSAELVDDKQGHYSIIRKRPLFLDDIGKEPMDVKIFGTPCIPVKELFSRRYVNGAITYATSNFNLESLTEFYGYHITDRMKSMFNFITKKGNSRRT